MSIITSPTQFLRLSAASFASGLSVSTLRRAINRGDLPAHRRGTGTAILVGVDDLQRFVRGELATDQAGQEVS